MCSQGWHLGSIAFQVRSGMLFGADPDQYLGPTWYPLTCIVYPIRRYLLDTA